MEIPFALRRCNHNLFHCYHHPPPSISLSIPSKHPWNLPRSTSSALVGQYDVLSSNNSNTELKLERARRNRLHNGILEQRDEDGDSPEEISPGLFEEDTETQALLHPDTTITPTKYQIHETTTRCTCSLL